MKIQRKLIPKNFAEYENETVWRITRYAKAQNLNYEYMASTLLEALGRVIRDRRRFRLNEKVMRKRMAKYKKDQSL